MMANRPVTLALALPPRPARLTMPPQRPRRVNDAGPAAPTPATAPTDNPRAETPGRNTRAARDPRSSKLAWLPYWSCWPAAARDAPSLAGVQVRGPRAA